MNADRQEQYPKGTYRVLFMRAPGGVLYSLANLSSGASLCFHSLTDLIRYIDEDLTAGRFPQTTLEYRDWGLGPAPGPERAQSRERPPAEAPPAVGEESGPSFIVKVIYRQHATWQGTIQWMEGRQTRQYRSVNELLKLMDEADELFQNGMISVTA